MWRTRPSVRLPSHQGLNRFSDFHEIRFSLKIYSQKICPESSSSLNIGSMTVISSLRAYINF